MIWWLLTYIVFFGLVGFVLPQSVRMNIRLFNRLTLENELYKFIKKQKNWQYAVIHFASDGSVFKDATCLSVYTDRKRLVPLQNYHALEREAWKLDEDVRKTILENDSDEYVFHDHGYKTMDGRTGVKIAKHVALLLGCHVKVKSSSVGGSAGFFYSTGDGVGYCDGDSGTYGENFIVIYSKDKWKEYTEKSRQKRNAYKQKGYKKY